MVVGETLGDWLVSWKVVPTDYYARIAERLAAIFHDFMVETFLERYHFDPLTVSSPNASPCRCSHSRSGRPVAIAAASSAYAESSRRG